MGKANLNVNYDGGQQTQSKEETVFFPNLSSIVEELEHFVKMCTAVKKHWSYWSI